MDSVAAMETFRSMLIIGLGAQFMILYIVGLNNNCLGALSHYTIGFQLFFPFAASLYFITGITEGFGSPAAWGLAALSLFNLVVALPLTLIHRRKDPQWYLDIERAVSGKHRHR